MVNHPPPIPHGRSQPPTMFSTQVVRELRNRTPPPPAYYLVVGDGGAPFATSLTTWAENLHYFDDYFDNTTKPTFLYKTTYKLLSHNNNQPFFTPTATNLPSPAQQRTFKQPLHCNKQPSNTYATTNLQTPMQQRILKQPLHCNIDLYLNG